MCSVEELRLKFFHLVLIHKYFTILTLLETWKKWVSLQVRKIITRGIESSKLVSSSSMTVKSKSWPATWSSCHPVTSPYRGRRRKQITVPAATGDTEWIIAFINILPVFIILKAEVSWQAVFWCILGPKHYSMFFLSPKIDRFLFPLS